MQRRLFALLATRRPARYFGLRRPEDRFYEKAIAEFSRIDKVETDDQQKPEPAKPAAPEPAVLEQTPSPEKEKEMNLPEMLFPRYLFANPDDVDTITRYDIAMGADIGNSKPMRNVMARAEKTHPIDKSKRSRLRFLPVSTGMALQSYLAEHKGKWGESEVDFASPLAPGEVYPLPAEYSLHYDEFMLQFHDAGFATFTKGLMNTICTMHKMKTPTPGSPEHKAMCEKETEEYYPPTLETYYAMLPKWARRHPVMRDAYIAMEFHKPNVSLREKEEGLNLLLRRLLPANKAWQLVYESMFDRFRYQMTMGRV